MQHQQRVVGRPRLRVARQGRFEEVLPASVGRVLARPEPETAEDALRVGIHHERWLLRCVEHDAVRRLRADAPCPEERGPEFVLRQGEQFAEAAVRSGQVQERSQLARLLAVLPARPDEHLQFLRRQHVHRFEAKHARRPQPGQRSLNVRPGRVLHQDRPHDNLERVRARLPHPAAPAVHGVELRQDRPQPRFVRSGDEHARVLSLRHASPSRAAARRPPSSPPPRRR